MCGGVKVGLLQWQTRKAEGRWGKEWNSGIIGWGMNPHRLGGGGVGLGWGNNTRQQAEPRLGRAENWGRRWYASQNGPGGRVT